MSLAAYIQKIMRFCAKHRNLLLSVCGTLCAVALFFLPACIFRHRGGHGRRLSHKTEKRRNSSLYRF